MEEKIEIWKKIDAYPNYMVSSFGRVKSFFGGKEKILSPGKARGYKQVYLSNNGKGKYYRVHRLVAQSFIPNPDNLPQVNHKNEIKTDNRVENLEWCDGKYNSNYGTGKWRCGAHFAKEVEQYTLDGKYVATYPSTHEASRQTGIDQSNIVKNIKGKYPYAGGYVFRYKEKGAA